MPAHATSVSLHESGDDTNENDDDDDDDESASSTTHSREERRQALLQYYGATTDVSTSPLVAPDNRDSGNPFASDDDDDQSSSEEDGDGDLDIVSQLLLSSRQPSAVASASVLVSKHNPSRLHSPTGMPTALGTVPPSTQSRLDDYHLPVTAIAGRYASTATAAVPPMTQVNFSMSDDEHDVGRNVAGTTMLRSEFEAAFRTSLGLTRWLPSQETTVTASDDPASYNCFGVIHVRVLRAQRLPCPVHSHVQTIVRLLPWKGKVRLAQRAISFVLADEETLDLEINPGLPHQQQQQPRYHGVCVDWGDADDTILDDTEHDHSFNGTIITTSKSVTATMVHAYSDQSSPLPTIQIDLVFTPMNMFEFSMCTLQIDCEPLLKHASVSRRQWFATAADVTDSTPLIEVEAVFEPALQEIDEEEDAETLIEETELTIEGKSSARPILNNLDEVNDHGSYVDNQSTDNDAASLAHQSLVSSVQSSTLRKKRTLKSKQHLLQITLFRAPASCCICGNSLMSGPLLVWKRLALRCEECKVDCCDDCRLQIDAQLPCGSALAQRAVAEAIQNRLSLDKILSVIAPVGDANLGTYNAADGSALLTDNDSITAVKEPPPTLSERGIGVLKLEFIRAHVWAESLPADTDSQAILLDESNNKKRLLRPGDYYIRVARSGSEKTVRTPTIQQSNGRPSLEYGEMRFVVPHYGTEFRIELIDATTDRPVGRCLLTTQGLLQQQRDYLIEEKQVPFLSFLRPIRFKEMRRSTVELRGGFKNGFGADFFLPTKKISSADEDVNPGDVVGCVELLACLEEDYTSLFGSTPYECPPRPGEELNMSVFQLHLLRLSNLVDDAKQFVESYKYVVSWKNPLITSISLYVYLRMCFAFDPAYMGSLPILISIFGMLYLAVARMYGTMKQKYIRKEIERNRKAEKGIVKYDVHRPMGLIRTVVEKGRNIRSPELGLPGNVGCRVYWDPTRLCPEKQKKKLIELDQGASATHDVGTTLFVYSMNPVWEQMFESDNATRLKLLMPNQGMFFDKNPGEEEKEKTYVDFPILQPIGINGDLHVLEPWNSCMAALVVEVQFFDLLNVIPGSEYPIGEVVIPFEDLIKRGGVSDWFTITGNDVASRSPLYDIGKQAVSNTSNGDIPQLFLKVTWEPPRESVDKSARETEIESSYAIQEELVRSAMLTKHQKEKFNFFVSSMGAFNSMRGISANLHLVQNSLGAMLDVFESCLHGLDFTDPFKSILVLVALTAVWIILSVVSTRVILLCLGLAQYGITFKARFERWMRSGRSSKKATNTASIQSAAPSHMKAWIWNAIRGLPTSEDLRRTYYWESKRRGAQETESLAAAKRKSRMQRLWRVQWCGTVHLLAQGKTDRLEWRNVFALIQGRRLLWWRSVGDFDNGVSPLGRLFLAGHAGLSSPSPLELRTLSPDEVQRVVCIFGSGSRATILTQSILAKEDMEEVVLNVVTVKVE